MLKDTYTYTDLIEACSQPGCPLCWLAQRSVRQYIRMLFYEHVNDIDLRAGIRSSLGYCEEHTWALLDASLGNALGVSIIYHDLLTNILRGLPKAEAAGAGGGPLAAFNRFGQRFKGRVQTAVQALTGKNPCPACTIRQETDHLAGRALMRALADEKVAAPFRAAYGLCLPHLRQCLPHIEDPAVLETILETTQTRLSSLDSELAEFIRKNDYRFSKEAWGSERDAWQRAIPRMAGERLKT